MLFVLLGGAARAQFEPSRPDFDADGRPQAHVEDDNGSRVSQNFRGGWGPLEPRFDLTHGPLSVAWDPPSEPRPGRLRFSGRLVLESVGSQVLPLGWPQGITVLVGRDPIRWDGVGANPRQWAQGIGYTETDGRFAVEILGADLRRFVGIDSVHVVGVALAEHRTKSSDEGVVSWLRNPVPLDASRRACVVPASRPLSDALASINATNLEVAYHHDPSRTVRCVNLLRTLGKDEALRALREYCSIAFDGGTRCVDARSIDQSHYFRALGVAVLAFEPPTAEPPWIHVTDDERRKRVPLFPFVLLEDLPLVLRDRFIPTARNDAIAFLDRCESFGTLRGSDLRPTDDPMAAIDAFLDGEDLPRLLELRQASYWETGMAAATRAWNEEHVLAQAFPCVREALPDAVRRHYEHELDDHRFLPHRGRTWRAMTESARARRLRWDAAQGRYVVD